MHKRRSSTAHIDRLLYFWIWICLPVPEIQSENKKQHTNNLALPTKSEGHDNGGNELMVMLMRGHDNNKQNIASLFRFFLRSLFHRKNIILSSCESFKNNSAGKKARHASTRNESRNSSFLYGNTS